MFASTKNSEINSTPSNFKRANKRSSLTRIELGKEISAYSNPFEIEYQNTTNLSRKCDISYKW